MFAFNHYCSICLNDYLWANLVARIELPLRSLPRLHGGALFYFLPSLQPFKLKLLSCLLQEKI